MVRNTQKDPIRRLALLRRGQIEPSQRASFGVAIHERVRELPEMSGARSVLAFVSVRSEVPTDELLKAVLTEGKTLLLPYVDDDGTLRATAVDSLDELAPGFQRILEPRTRRPVDSATAGVVVVPGVAFDVEGGRLGYGGGFYDVLLRTMPEVPRVGICFETQVVERVPVEEHDERVDVLITEERVIRCKDRRSTGTAPIS
jgi:5-formyltetrahydrofolate cyclo-ligase